MVTTHRLTYQDYANLEGDERYELLDGRLVPVPSRNTAHQAASIRLMSEMYFFIEENGLGRLYPAPFDVLFTNFRRRTARPALHLRGQETHHHARQRAGSSGHGRRDTVACDVEDGLARQAGTVRPPRRQGVLDRRPHTPDSVDTPAPGRRARDHSRPAPRAMRPTPRSSRASASAWRSFSRSNHPLRLPQRSSGCIPRPRHPVSSRTWLPSRL